jgi:hypothetical protein
MDYEDSVLGGVFSEWTQLTEEYARSMDALRRREPGASSRMMEIYRRICQCQQRLGFAPVPQIVVQRPAPQQAATPRGAGWLTSTMDTPFGARKNGRPQPELSY